MSDLSAEMAAAMTPSVAGLEYTIQKVNSRGLLIIGSVGRAAVFHDLVGDPNIEFRERGEEPLCSNQRTYGIKHPRDVDTIGGPISDANDRHFWPHTPDTRAFYGNNHALSLVRTQTDTWIAHRGRHGGISTQTEIDPIIFAPVTGKTIHGVACETVRPATHYALVEGSSWQKMQLAERLLMKAMPPDEAALLKTPSYQELRSILQYRRRW